MVDAHPDIAITRETHWIAKRFERQKGVTAGGLVTPELFSRLLSYEKFTRIGSIKTSSRGLWRLRSRSHTRLRHRRLRSLRKGAGQAPGRGQDSCLREEHPTLHELWPEAKFVHIVRDGRDVALSAVHTGTGPANWPTASLPGRRPDNTAAV